MELIRGLHSIKAQHKGCVATIGNFDGMHLGHQRILSQVIERAQALNSPSMVIILEPQPKELLLGKKSPPRLMCLREKLQALKKHGIDYVLCLAFNHRIRRFTAEQVVEGLFVKALAIKHLIVGDDFHFGYDRSGDFKMLQSWGQRYNFGVENTLTYDWQGKRISSTWIRELLAAGQLELTAQLLGKPYSICGRVVYGRQLGKTLGTPTINIALKRNKAALAGVFAVKVVELTESPLFGVANLGYRPTVDSNKEALEVHLFDFKQEVYRKHVNVQFLHKIRDEKKFNTIELLKHQINLDIVQAKKFLKEYERL